MCGVLSLYLMRVKRKRLNFQRHRLLLGLALTVPEAPLAFVCTIPAAPTVQRDDEDLRITRWDFAPGAVTGWHTHGWPYFVIMLTDGVLKRHDGTDVAESVMKAGDAYSRPSGMQHDVMNGSDHPIAFVEIEVKRPQAIPFP